jgi:hypothetical protein
MMTPSLPSLSFSLARKATRRYRKCTVL